MANERSVEIPIYLKLDKASYDKVEKAIQEAQSRATVTTNDIRARRGMPPRVSRVPVQGINYRDLASKVAQDYLKALGQEFDAKTKLVMPQFTFGGKYLQDLLQIPEEIEDYVDFFRNLNQAIFQFAKASGLKRQEIDLQDLDEEKLFDLLEGKMIQIKDKLIPNLEHLEDLHALTLAEAGKLNIPTMVAQTGTMPVTKVRALPKGSFREFQDTPQSKAVIEEFRKRFEAGQLEDVISEALQKQAQLIMEKTVNSLRTLPEDVQTVQEGSDALGYWIKDAKDKFLNNMLSRGFEPGSEARLAEILAKMYGEQIGQTQQLLINNLLSGSYVEGTTNLSTGIATPLRQQVFNNPALMTTGRMGKGALSELKQSLSGQTEAQQKYAKLAKEIDESVARVAGSSDDVIAVFDTEFNNKLPHRITEAAIELRSAGGEFIEGLTWVHTASAQMENLQKEGAAMAGLPDAASAADFEKRFRLLGKATADTSTTLFGGVGSRGAEANFQEFYDKLFVLTKTLGAYAQQGVPVYGANIQGAEFSNLSKSIAYVNGKLDEMGSTLPRLLYPAELEIKDVQQTLRDASKAGDQFATVLTKEGVNVGKVLSQLPEDMRKGFQLGKGGDFSTEGVPGHYALADIRATFAIFQALRENLGTMADVRTTKKVRGYGGTGGGGLDSHIASGDAAEGGRKYALALSQINAELALMTPAERKNANAVLESLTKTKEHQKAMEALLHAEARLKEVRAKGGAGTEEEQKLLEVRDRAYLTAVKLERQQFQNVKAAARQGQVQNKLQQTAAKAVDTQIELEKAQQKVFAADIKGQMLDQEAAIKRVATANRDLMNTWVTGRYALYDVGNAFENVSRNMAMATRRIFEITNAFRSYETAFTAVERTLPTLAASAAGADAEMGSLKQQFIDMSQVLPIAFEELAGIATLGAQMGVSASGIATFTETVAKFAAITAISTDTVAQKFGRIAELADVDYAQMNNLGSSIAYAGINAVATESEILSLSESIAAVSNMAGMLPADIVGISTALASVGVQSEQARGVFTRVFADIDRAVSEGGDSLQAFATLSGMSAESFAASWGTEGQSYAVFRNLLGGLGAAEDMTKAFDSLNIVETREINTLTRLAKNLNVVDQAFSDATTAFEQGTFLGDAFEKTIDNLDAKIQVFTNNINALTEELSKSMAGTLTGVIDGANLLLESLRDVASTEIFGQRPFGGAAMAALAIAGIGTAATMAISVMAKLVAQVYAFNVASINTANSANNVSGSIRSTLNYLAGWKAGLVEVRDELQGVNGNVRGAVQPMQFYASTIDKQQSALRQRNILLIDVAQIQKAENVSQQEALVIARQRVDAINQQKAAMTGAAGETIVYATAEGKLSSETAKTNLQLNNQTQAVIKTSGAMAGLGRTAVIAQAAMRGVTIAFSALSTLTLVATGIGLVNAALEKSRVSFLDAGGGLASLRDAIREDTLEYNKLKEAGISTANKFSEHTVKVEVNTTALNENAQEIANVIGTGKQFVDANALVTSSLESQTFALGKNTKEWLANAMMQDEALQNVLEQYPTLFKDVAAAGYDLGSIVKQIFDDPNKSIEELMPGIVKARTDVYQEFRRLQDAATSAMDPEVSADLQAQANAAEEFAYKLQLAQEVVESLKGTLATGLGTNEIFNAIRAALGLNDAFEDTEEAADDASDAVDGLTRSLRTVLDYASDLSGIFSRVIELELGKQMQADKLTTGWRNLAKEAEDAAKAVEDYQNTQKELAADRTILQYQLSVAERYGDEKRAAELRAQIAKKDADIVENNKKLAEAQDNASTSLVGNSDAAIKNRASLIGMVSEYQSYIEMLAKLGRNSSQLEGDVEVLKRKFLEQAKGLGYSSEELQQYADLFDGFIEVAADAPRNVDVEVNLALSAAEQAIEEFLSKDRTVTIDTELNDEDAAAKWAKRKAELEAKHPKLFLDVTPAEMAAQQVVSKLNNTSATIKGKFELDRAYLQQRKTYYYNLLRTQKPGSSGYQTYQELYLIMNRILNSIPAYAGGGLITGAGSSTSDSIPAMLSNGEYVMSASAVRTYGADFFNALNQQRTGSTSAPMQFVGSSSSGSQIVYLSPDDRALLRAAIDRPVNLYADNTKIAQSANAGNQRLSQRGLK